ncbi:GNAT family N-acetyltransferase [soil metagenome]
MEVRPGNLSDPAVIALLRFHLEQLHANSPPGSVFALDLSGLAAADVTFWTMHAGPEVIGCGALKRLDFAHGEIKSMRTAPAHLRRGAAAEMLNHIVAEARSRGYTRISLETGSGPAFEPALALYRAHGFVTGEAFADYEKSPFNQFLTLAL